MRLRFVYSIELMATVAMKPDANPGDGQTDFS